MTASDLTALTPAEIDTLWANEMEPVWALQHEANRNATTAASYARYGGAHAKTAQRYENRATELRQQARELRDTIEPPFTAEWDRRGGWNRAWLVPDGHIHRSCSCHTLHPTTIVSWLPEQSGLAEAEIVANAAEMACTVCYPTAPVAELRVAAKAAKDEAKAQERAVKAAAAAAKAITAVDGSPLKDDHGYTVKTEVAARRELSGALENAVWYPQSAAKFESYAARLADAIAAKTGESASALVAAAQAKAAKKVAREMRAA
jgi:hypothetical protein